MSQERFLIDECPVGFEESWEKFPWASYPNGVKVSFALTKGQEMLLVKLSRWTVELPECSLSRGQVLADAVVWLHGHLGSIGARLVSGDLSPEVCACERVNGAFHVLINVPCIQATPAFVFERVDNALLLSGFASDRVMSSHAAHMLGWNDAQKHLPLPIERLAAQTSLS